MVVRKRCLIIDDEDQTAEIERLYSFGEKKGLAISCEQFSVGSQKRADLFDGKNLNKDKVFNAFKKECTGGYDLIAFDYQLQDEGGITGIDLVKILGSEKKSSIKIVYSGILDTILSDILNKYAEKKTDFKKAKASIVTLFNAGVTDYVERVGRVGYEEILVDHLTKDEFASDKLLIRKLEEYGKLEFRSTYPLFKGKLLSEIAAEIDRAGNPHSSKFQIELIEQAISNMIDLNTKQS